MTGGGGEDDEAAVTGGTTTTLAAGTPAPGDRARGHGSHGDRADSSADPVHHRRLRPAGTGHDRARRHDDDRATRGATRTAPTTPPPPGTGVRQGSACSPEGATAITQDGVPMTCTAQKCHGAPFDSPRWRRTAC